MTTPYYVRVSPLYCSTTGERCGTRIGVAHRNLDCHGLRGSGRIMRIDPGQLEGELRHAMSVCRHCCGERKADPCPASA